MTCEPNVTAPTGLTRGMTMKLYVYGDHAFRDELQLFRAHRVPAGEAEPVEVDGEAADLFRVEHLDTAPSYWTCALAALDAFRAQRGVRMAQIAIA